MTTATTTTIDASGITNTDIYEGTVAGTLSATVSADGSAITDATVTWSSSDTDVATIDANGAVTLVAAGTTTITASYAGDDTYAASSATYELTVTDSTPFEGGDITFDATVDKGDETITKKEVTFSCSNGELSSYDHYRLYKSSITRFSLSETIVNQGYRITGISFTGVDDAQYALSNFSGQTGWNVEGNNGTWTGEATSVSFTASQAQVRATQIVVTVETLPTYTASFSMNGIVTSTADVMKGSSITFPEVTVPEGYSFLGWTDSAIDGTSDEEPEMLVSSATMGDGDVTYYAVFAVADGSGETVETRAQTLQYDTWTYSGTTTNKSSYRLFGNGSYIESAAFDLSKLSKVVVYGGTFGGGTYNSLTIGDENGNVWKNVTVSGSNQTGTNTYTDGTALTGTAKLRVKSNSGDGSNTGIRISKVEIFIEEPGVSYRDYCTTIPVPTVEVNITAVGMATFCSDQALDFTGLTDMYAYIAKYNDGKVTYHRVNKVPANTGVMLRNPNSAAATQNVPVLTGDADNVEGNKFIGTLEEISALASTTDTNTNYILNNGSNGLGFYKANNKKLGAGKAYLQLPTEGAKSFIGFDEEGVATAINAIEGEQLSGNIYDLQGRVVMNPAKGIYVVNGKKVVIK